MNKEIEIKGEVLDILFDGQKVLTIDQVFDDNVVDFYFIPHNGMVIENHEKVEEDDPCTHQMLVVRKRK